MPTPDELLDETADPTDPRSYIPTSDLWCCWASVNGDACTCWVPLHGEQAEPNLEQHTLHARAEPCGSCAYRGGTVANELLEEEELVPSRRLFLCHEGMRRIIGFRHEGNGQVVTLPTDVDLWNHDPLVTEDGRPWKADGSIADLCRGWAKRTGKMTLEVSAEVRL